MSKTSVDALVGDALKVLKVYPNKDVVIHHNGTGPGIVAEVLNWLGIPYQLVEDPDEFHHAERHVGPARDKIYTLDLTGHTLDGEYPGYVSLEKLRAYWENGQPPKTL